ncbi:MAG TPA: glycosyltransferase family 4 protein [Candidatus Angelobacter sp.]|nr:glycosyltransferase family 4 protein [Candidatus Angelobacter sp.]
MRLTLVISTLGRGGAERVMSILASAWAERGHQVTLLTLDRQKAPAYPIHPAVNLQRLGVTGFSANIFQALYRNLHRLRSLRQAIRKSDPDVVISFMDSVNVLTILATRGLHRTLIISERTDPSLYKIGRAWNALRRLYSLADLLVCPTQNTVDRFRAISRVHGVGIPNPIHLPARPAAQRPPRARHRIIAMGRLVPQKGFDLLLSAFAAVADRHPDWDVTIYGEGPLLSALQSQADALKIGSRVHFAGTVSDPFTQFLSADMFVFSSRFEGFGMALAEAMACGLPVVSFDCPEGPGQIIRDGIDGILVPPQDVAALARTLDRLMGDPQERQRLAQRAPEVRERFSLERALAGWQAAFDGLLAGKQPNAHHPHPTSNPRSVGKH